MSALPSTSRLKVEPQQGEKPVLEWVPLDKMGIDSSYQRSLDSPISQSLIRRIAQFWDWNLCQPLTVARRVFGPLRVVDGQHRLAAARLRGDIEALPCVIAAYASAGDEAAAFVALNQQRRPLVKLDLFKAALAAEDQTAVALSQMILNAGLTVAPHTNYTVWKPGMFAHITPLDNAYRGLGEKVAAAALNALAEAFRGEVLRYAGPIYSGVAGFIASECVIGGEHEEAEVARAVRHKVLVTALRSLPQADWKTAILHEMALSGSRRYVAAKAVVAARYALCGGRAPRAEPKLPTTVQPTPPRRDRPREAVEWPVICEQCDRRTSEARAMNCTDKFCKLRDLAR